MGIRLLHVNKGNHAFEKEPYNAELPAAATAWLK